MNTRAAPSNTTTIARNSFWAGLEVSFNVVAALITSIVVARVIGPQRLDQYNFVMWLTTVTTAVGTFGLPITIRKYMAECLNRGDRGVARSIYRMGIQVQTLISGGVTAVGLLLVLLGNPSQQVISGLLVITVMPRMIVTVPSQANNAAELVRRNTGAALTAGLLNIGLTLFSLWIGWGLYGVAASLTLSATLELILKLRAVDKWLGDVTPVAIPAELKNRMVTYSGEGLVLLLLNVLVWDRSDLLILKALNHVPGQITFFSLSFNFAERLLMLPNSFAGSLAVTMMAQYGRGENRMQSLTVSGAKYTFLLSLPLLAGMASVSGPVVRVVLGPAYEGMIPVLAIASVLAIPKSLLLAPTTLLQTTEKQRILIWIGCIGGALDIALDVVLTPSYGAAGAAVANGVAQTVAAILIWWQVRRIFGMDLRLGEFARITACAVVMSGAAVAVWQAVPGVAGLALSIVTGASIWLLMLRLLRAINKTDADRLLEIGRALKGRPGTVYRQVVGLLRAA